MPEMVVQAAASHEHDSWCCDECELYDTAVTHSEAMSLAQSHTGATGHATVVDAQLRWTMKRVYRGQNELPDGG